MDEDKQESKKKEELENRKEFEDENENEKNENEYEVIDWDDVIEEEKSSEELLKEYNESLMKLTRIENKVRGMNRFARTLERGKEEYRIRDVVFKTYEELYYKLKKDVLKEVQEYNHIVSGWNMERWRSWELNHCLDISMKTFVKFLKRFWKLLKERRIELKEKGGGKLFLGEKD